MSDTLSTALSGTSSGSSTPSTSSASLHSLSSSSLNTLGLELGSTNAKAGAIAVPTPTAAPVGPVAPVASPPTLTVPAAPPTTPVSGYITPERISKPLGSSGALWGNVAWERAFNTPPRGA